MLSGSNREESLDTISSYLVPGISFLGEGGGGVLVTYSCACCKHSQS